jgi:hypothetical protein
MSRFLFECIFQNAYIVVLHVFSGILLYLLLLTMFYAFRINLFTYYLYNIQYNTAFDGCLVVYREFPLNFAIWWRALRVSLIFSTLHKAVTNMPVHALLGPVGELPWDTYPVVELLGHRACPGGNILKLFHRAATLVRLPTSGMWAAMLHIHPESIIQVSHYCQL